MVSLGRAIGLGAAAAAAAGAAAAGVAADRAATGRRRLGTLDPEDGFAHTADVELKVIATDGVNLHVEVDTPEIHPTAQCYGVKAADRTAALLPKGSRVRVQRDRELKDRYGRTVANVRCGQTDVASEQVRSGLAWVAPSYAKAHPHLAPLQQQARTYKRGLWAQRRPVAPWTYRHRYQR